MVLTAVSHPIIYLSMVLWFPSVFFTCFVGRYRSFTENRRRRSIHVLKRIKCSSSLLQVETLAFPYFNYAYILLIDLSSDNKTKHRAHNLCIQDRIYSHTSLTVTVRSKNMFAFSNDERALNIASFSHRSDVKLSTFFPYIFFPEIPDDVNMLGENPETIRENTAILLEASKAIGLEVNPEKTKCMVMSRDENILRNGNIKIGDLSFEYVEKFKYIGAAVTNINDTREEIKRRINMENACIVISLLSKNLKVRIYKTVLLPVVLIGCETWTLTLRGTEIKDV
ncbi:hypothetical protein ANN_22928 [Periplaneta americana]|uniref:Uncharacterized protein n=1 Tax=Periplaneta americana TaxID=6978 RepID=A0ABQ8SJN1_PERAM|nr:hypothetical protein ANN_22928 [Periplaneta americana]